MIEPQTRKTPSTSLTFHVANLKPEEFGVIICYPHYTVEEFLSRVKELEQLGVCELEFDGATKIHGHSILGKGHNSLVVHAKLNNQRHCALKIRRIDASRKNMLHEVEMLRYVNNVNVGPTLYGYGNNFITLELISGMVLHEWIRTLDVVGEKNVLRSTLRNALHQARRLDIIRVDHGELSRATHHVIITLNYNEPVIIDFETASTSRRPSNVTALSQYIFFSRECSEAVTRILGGVSREKIIRALRRYKTQPTDESFNLLLEICRLNGW